jgi:hypothetical protein
MSASLYWPHVVVNSALNGTAPADCEVNSLTALAVAECDPLDGVVDGVISDVAACETAFNAYAHVGANATNCTDGSAISRGAAVYVNSTWAGPRAADGRFLWYGQNIGSPILDDNSKSVQALVGGEWIRRFVAKNTSFDLDAMAVQDFEWLFHSGVSEFDSIIGASDGDLREFRRQNGKMITFHGMVSILLLVQSRCVGL